MDLKFSALAWLPLFSCPSEIHRKRHNGAARGTPGARAAAAAVVARLGLADSRPDYGPEPPASMRARRRDKGRIT